MKCKKCGSRAWHIAWDPVGRVWYCVRNRPTESLPEREKQRPRPRVLPASVPMQPDLFDELAPRADPVAEVEPEPPDDLVSIVCSRCGNELLRRALPGTTAWCRRCRRWSP